MPENNINDDDNSAEEHEELVECSWCEEAFAPEDLEERLEVDGGTRWTRSNAVLHLCASCDEHLVRCSDCHMAYDGESDSLTRIGWDHLVCNPCYEAFYGYCELHECDYHVDEGCSGCEEDSGGGLVHDYGFRPDPMFFIKTDGSGLWRIDNKIPVTGFELEVEVPTRGGYSYEDCATEALAKLGHHLVYLKHDGSLENGFEIVSHPFSHEFLTGALNYQGLRDLAQMGVRSAQTDTCGLHVHINRAFFAQRPTTLYRFMSLLYRNAEQWKRLAGRSRSHYAVWDDQEADRMLGYVMALRDEKRFRHTDRQRSNYSRYVAVNLQPAHTIELRFFKGTLRPETFAARIEAVHAMALYAMATWSSVDIKTAHDWSRFREWTVSNKFNLFNTYAESKGI